jgi:hypothetical protein
LGRPAHSGRPCCDHCTGNRAFLLAQVRSDTGAITVGAYYKISLKAKLEISGLNSTARRLSWQMSVLDVVLL